MTWFKVDDGLPDHRKVRQLGSQKAAAMGVWVLCGAWSASNLSDGFVPAEIVARYDPRRRYAARLVEVGLWEPGEQDGEAGFLFHDWSDIQPTKHQVEAKREQVRRRVAQHRQSKSAGPERPDPKGGPEPGNATGNALHGEPVTPDVLTGARACAGVPSRPVPSYKERTSSSEIADAIPDTENPPEPEPEPEQRPDVERLCAHLAHLVEGNTGRRPTIGKRWHDSARLLLDRDLAGETDPLGLALRLATWATSDDFWRSNILSMPKFREKFPQLRLKARTEWERSRRSAPQSTLTSRAVASADAAVAEYERRHGGTVHQLPLRPKGA